MSWRSKYEAMKGSFYAGKEEIFRLKWEVEKLQKLKTDAEIFHKGMVNIIEHQKIRIDKLERALQDSCDLIEQINPPCSHSYSLTAKNMLPDLRKIAGVNGE